MTLLFHNILFNNKSKQNCQKFHKNVYLFVKMQGYWKFAFSRSFTSPAKGEFTVHFNPIRYVIFKTLWLFQQFS